MDFNINKPCSPNINPNRTAALPREEQHTKDDTQDCHTLPHPNRAAHEQLKSQQLQRMWNENSGAQSMSHSKNDSHTEPFTTVGMTTALSEFLPLSWMKLSPREELQLKLNKFKKHFEALKKHNYSPDSREFYCDVALLPIAVKAENARKPGLNLHNFDSFEAFTGALKRGDLQNGRAILPVFDESPHVVAADVRTIDGKISILVLESLTLKRDNILSSYIRSSAPRMSAELPENAELSILSIDAQKAANGCRMFALSAASTLAKEFQFLDAFHEDNLSGQLDAFHISESEIKKRLKDTPLDKTSYPNVRVIDAHRLVPASFLKHIQSMSSLKAWNDEDKLTQTTVNKDSEALLFRFNRHSVERYKKEGSDSEEEGGLKKIRFSASIEEKRLTYLDHAIAYLDNASQEEVSDFLRALDEATKKHQLDKKESASLLTREMWPNKPLPQLSRGEYIKLLSLKKYTHSASGFWGILKNRHIDAIKVLGKLLPLMPQEKCIEILAAKDADGVPGLHKALEEDDAESIEVLSELLRQMPQEQLEKLLTANDAELLTAIGTGSVPGLYMALCNGHTDAIRAFGKLLSLVPPEWRVKLLEAKDADEAPGIAIALMNGNIDAIKAFGELLSLVPPEQRAELLNPDNNPWLAMAFQTASSEAMEALKTFL